MIVRAVAALCGHLSGGAEIADSGGGKEIQVC